MKYIPKNINNEPQSLREYRSTPGANYNDCNKEDIRNALLLEQGFICAYCNQRTKEGVDSSGNTFTTIEHFKAQADNDEGEQLKLNYLNMLGVCRGNEGNPKHLLHCDRSKGNQNLFIDPTLKSCESFVKCKLSGVLFSEDERVENNINQILNLNNENLVKARKAVLDKAINRMKSRYKKTKKRKWKEADLKSEIQYWEKKEKKKFQPFCQAAIFYLNKKLSRLT